VRSAAKLPSGTIFTIKSFLKPDFLRSARQPVIWRKWAGLTRKFPRSRLLARVVESLFGGITSGWPIIQQVTALQITRTTANPWFDGAGKPETKERSRQNSEEQNRRETMGCH